MSMHVKNLLTTQRVDTRKLTSVVGEVGLYNKNRKLAGSYIIYVQKNDVIITAEQFNELDAVASELNYTLEAQFLDRRPVLVFRPIDEEREDLNTIEVPDAEEEDESLEEIEESEELEGTKEPEIKTEVVKKPRGFARKKTIEQIEEVSTS